jgi:hypothetical protein
MSQFLTHYQSAAACAASVLSVCDFAPLIANSYPDSTYIQAVAASVRPSVCRPYQPGARSVIDAIENLEADWDGYGATPISSAVCVNAKSFLAVSRAGKMLNPDITPTSNGTLNFEWSSNNADAYLEIGRTRFSGHIQSKRGSTVYLSGSLTESVTKDSGIQQALALISGLLHGTPSTPSLAQGIQVTESTL